MKDEMIDDFKVEAIELLEEAEEALLELEKGASFKDSYNQIFRAMHSLKGAAGMFELTELQGHMHQQEHLLQSKKSADALSQKEIDFFLKGVDAAREYLNIGELVFNEIAPEESQKKTATSEKKQEQKTVTNPYIVKAKKGVVFIVDDEEDMLEVIKDALSGLCLELVAFTNAKELLQKLREVHPDAIVSDFRMPSMSGGELMNEVSKTHPHLPFILVSGYVTKDVCIQCLAAGVSGIVEKPFESEHLSGMVGHAVTRYQAFKLLNRSIDLVIYQFSELEQKLEHRDNSGKKVVKQELKTILLQKKILLGKQEKRKKKAS